MIVVDTSAIVAILREEQDGAALAERLGADDEPSMSAATLLEASIVLRTIDKKSAHFADEKLDELVRTSGLQVRPVTLDLANEARRAHVKFGKGTGHPAQLNFGDCFAYALAKSLNAKLLYKGGDFAKTDIVSAV
ncbi:MAG: type II toxin-antitoxin system VapC family toxin [Devosia nanyangense]|uniref:Ribonuclease VapC n=1 Tax=Devosia nanyangense TaxID=1228055 RepID=A0A933NZT0_9HYPH|nr:type II toxin-antitoxin system VapC family toxin [Devosia nanyangense]